MKKKLILVSALMLAMPQSVFASESVEKYNVVYGDTLKAIATSHNVSVEELVKYNNIEDPNKIYVGQVVNIPTSEEVVDNTDKEDVVDNTSKDEVVESSWKTDYVNLVGQEAILYCYPVAKYATIFTAYDNYYKSEGREGLTNSYFHIRSLYGPEFKGSTSMNRDTIYSWGVVELTEPMVLTTGENPDGRYYSIDITDFYSDTIDYMGTRNTGDKAAAYLVVPPDWDQEIPELDNIDKVVYSPTKWIMSIGRTFTDNTPEDLAIANAMQDEYKVYPLSSWVTENPEEAPIRTDLPELPKENDPLSYLDYMNTWVKMVGYPQERDGALMKQYAQVGLGYDAEGSVYDLDEETQEGLIRAYNDAFALMDETSKNLGSIYGLNKTVNGWVYNPENWGRMGETGDFLGRAATQSYSGGSENLVEEAVKLRAFVDSEGNELDGANEYMMHFEPDQIPDVDGFWSVTAYDSEYNIRENVANKYEIRDIDPDLKYNEDGSLTIYLQSTKPEEEGANWLPVASDDKFNLFFRAYLPGEGFIDQSYIPPAITRIG